MEVANLTPEFSQFSISSRPAPARGVAATRTSPNIVSNPTPTTRTSQSPSPSAPLTSIGSVCSQATLSPTATGSTVNANVGKDVLANTVPASVVVQPIYTGGYGGGGGTPSGNDGGYQEQSEPEEIQETEIVDDSSDSDNDLANSTNFSGLANGKNNSVLNS